MRDIVDLIARSLANGRKLLLAGNGACNQISAGVPSLLFRRSRESGNLGISVTCSGPRFRGGDEFRCVWI
jgi:hypothetical protein